MSITHHRTLACGVSTSAWDSHEAMIGHPRFTFGVSSTTESKNDCTFGAQLFFSPSEKLKLHRLKPVVSVCMPQMRENTRLKLKDHRLKPVVSPFHNILASPAMTATPDEVASVYSNSRTR